MQTRILVIDDDRDMCELLEESLGRAGYRTIEVELDEFLKAGGSAKCLTLRLDGEEAAGWKVGHSLRE